MTAEANDHVEVANQTMYILAPYTDLPMVNTEIQALSEASDKALFDNFVKNGDIYLYDIPYNTVKNI